VIVSLVPEPPTSAGGRLDWSGIVLLCASVMALMLPLSKGGSWGWGSAATIGLFVLAAVLIAALLMVERRARNPLVDLARLARRPIVLTNLSSMLIGFALFSSFVGTSSYVQAPPATGYGFGSSILVAGLCLLPMGALMLLLAPLAARSIATWGAHRTLAVAAAVIALGLLFRIFFTDALWQVIVGTAIIGAGSGVSYSSLPSLINANTPRDELASANGVNSLARFLGSSLSSAIGGSVLAAITVSVGGVAFPSLSGYRVLFTICAVASVLVVVAALSIPATRAAAVSTDT
jgi:MFS family permease